MWRYLRKAKNTKKCEEVDFFNFLAIFRKVVALCGAISGVKKLIFSTFWQFSEKWWHYVALSPEGQKHKKLAIFRKVVALCGAMRRYLRKAKNANVFFHFLTVLLLMCLWGQNECHDLGPELKWMARTSWCSLNKRCNSVLSM